MAAVTEEDDDLTIFIIVISIVGGLVVIGLAIWLICCCARSISTPELKAQPQAPTVNAFAPAPMFVSAAPSQLLMAPPAPQSLAFVVEEDVSFNLKPDVIIY